MIGRHLLAAISQGVSAADEEVARAALGRIDWVLRGHAKRRLNQLLIDAALASGTTDSEDPEARRHVLRSAALLLMEDPTDLLDRDAVERAYDEKTAVQPSRVPVASIAAGAVVLALSTTIAAATVIVVTAPPPNATFTKPLAPEPAGAFVKGGTPRHDAAIESVLGELPKLVATKSATRDPVAFSSYPAVASTWRDLIDAVPGYDLADRSLEFDELRQRLAALSDQFVGAGLGYFVSLERTSKNEPAIGVYKIAKVTFVRANDERVRVLDAQRLGHASDPTKPVLGMKPEGLADPVVLLEEVTAHVANQYLPVLDGAPYLLADDFWGRTPRGRNATSAATRAIRRELGTALGGDAADRGRATTRLRKLVLASVRHHEAQHGREQVKTPNLPAELAKYVGPIQSNGRGNPLAVRARNELSAYISQIASDMWLPQASLWNLARHAFQSSRRGSPESFAAVIVLEGLARQLAISTDKGGAFRRGEIDRDRLADLVAPLASKTTIELRSAAARLWAELFEEPLVRLVDDVFGE